MAALSDRLQIEEKFATRLSGLMGRHRRELFRLMGTPPSVANVPESFWAKIEKEADEEAAAILLLILMKSSSQYFPTWNTSDDQVGIIRRKAGVWTKGRASELAKQYRDNTKKYLEKKSLAWGTVATPEEVNADLVDLLGPTRAERIAVTETTDAAVAGGEIAADVSGVIDPRDIWYTQMDRGVCMICLPYHKEPRVVWMTDHASGPPIHERCRCHIEYISDPMFAMNISILDSMLPPWFNERMRQAKFAKFGRSEPFVI